MTYTSRLPEAFALAHELHREQLRKATEVPYITHLMAVAALVGEHGGDEDQVIAALLHDAMEDQGGGATLERIRAAFGGTVAGYVQVCSDSDTTPKPPWRERKEAFLDHIGEAGPEVRLIIAADKIHNARATLRDLRAESPSIWQRFHGGQDGTLWYLDACLQALASGWAHPILDELDDVMSELWGAVEFAE